MNRPYRRLSLALTTLLFGGVLAACGNNNPSTTGEATTAPATAGTSSTTAPTTGTTSEATTAPTTGGTADIATPAATGSLMLPAECSAVELQYWNPFTGPDQPYMQELVDGFNAANPNISVVMTAQAEYNTQLSTAAASGTLPDVAIINEDQVATQAFNGVLRPIDELVSQMGFSDADFPAVAWGAGTIAERQYAVPLSFVAMTMYYNEDLLTAAGLSGPPTNAEEFAQAAAAMTANGNRGFLLTTGFPIQQIFQQLLSQFGGNEFSDDGTRATWNSEAGVEALQWMLDAQTNYSEPNLEVDADLNAFKSGTAGMIWNGSWQIPNLTGDAVPFAGRLAGVPQIGSKPAVWAGGPLLALPVQAQADPCKETAGAMLIQYLVQNSAQWARGGNVPAYNLAREDATFTALPQGTLATSVENPVFPPSVPGIGDAFVPLSEAISAIMSGSATDIKAALDDAAARADQILEQNRSNYGDTPPQ